MTSNDLERPQMISNGKKVKKSTLKAGPIQENIGISDQYLEEILENNII